MVLGEEDVVGDGVGNGRFGEFWIKVSPLLQCIGGLEKEKRIKICKQLAIASKNTRQKTLAVKR